MKIEKTSFDSLEAVKISTHAVEMIVVTGMGPRIARMSYKDSENLLYWEKDGITRGDWRLMGGHRLWASRPMGDEAEDAYAADNAPCTVEEHAGTLTVTGGIHPFLKIQRGLKIKALTDDTFEVTGSIRNCSDMLYSAGVWSLTCIDPRGGKQFGVPLGDNRLNWDIAKVIIPRAWGGHSSRLDDPQIGFTRDCIVLKPNGVKTKRMLMASLGIIAMTWPEKGISLLQRARFDPRGVYPVDANIAFYVAPENQFVEMEIMGAQETIPPGKSIEMPMIWKFSAAMPDWNDAGTLLREFEL